MVLATSFFLAWAYEGVWPILSLAVYSSTFKLASNWGESNIKAKQYGVHRPFISGHSKNVAPKYSMFTRSPYRDPYKAHMGPIFCPRQCWQGKETINFFFQWHNLLATFTQICASTKEQGTSLIGDLNWKTIGTARGNHLGKLHRPIQRKLLPSRPMIH